jgi:hypothetical protein
VFGPEYLRALDTQDIAQLLENNSARGFPCMLGSIDLHPMEVEEPSGSLA